MMPHIVDGITTRLLTQLGMMNEEQRRHVFDAIRSKFCTTCAVELEGKLCGCKAKGP